MQNIENDAIKKEIENVRNVQMEIMKKIHNICIENNLKYTLAYGTLLGAIRHKGYIPWDDDIDILMPRNDYEILKTIWSEKVGKDYILQIYDNCEDYSNNFMKIRKNNTTFLQFEEEKTKKYHKGIFVDIFPGDRVPSGKIMLMIQFALNAVNLLCARGYRSGNGGFYYILESMILFLPKKIRRILFKITERLCSLWNSTDNDFVFPGTIVAARRYFDGSLFDNLILSKFENEKFFITDMYDEMLKICYGDYMQLPDEKERVWKHHPLIIDLNKNYEDLE